MANSVLTARPSLRPDAARNRSLILDAARAMLASGDETLPLNAIAHHLGLGVGTVYRHFPNRQALLEGLAVDAFEELVDKTRSAADDPSPAVALDGLLRRSLDLQLEVPSLAEVLASPEPVCMETMGLGADLADSLQRLLSRARKTGVIRDDVSGDDLRRLVAGILHATRSSPDRPAQAHRHLTIMLAGLRP